MDNQELYVFCLNYVNVFEKYKNKCTN
jgi:hypothetical protein